MNEDQFDEDEVIELVNNALAECGKTAFSPEHIVPLSFGDSRLLETLAETLPKHMHQADVIMILDELKDKLYSGVNLTSLKDVHSLSLNCRKCPAMIADPKLPTWNVSDPDMIIVAESPFRFKDQLDLLVSNLKGVGFSSKRIMLTYINRCNPKESRKATAGEIKNCTSYLAHEIHVLRPKLILCLGAIPSATLLGADIKIGSEHGKICWLGPWAILPTYSPTYVLKAGSKAESTFNQDIQHAYSFVYGASK